MGAGQCATAKDGWTERTIDGSLAAHFEHTIVITDKAPILLTAALDCANDREIDFRIDVKKLTLSYSPNTMSGV